MIVRDLGTHQGVGKGKPELGIVSCVHGEEVFGKTVFDHFSSRSELYESMRLIFANEAAYEAGVQLIDSNLNRGFGPDGPTEGNEASLVPQIRRAIRPCPLILDIHTTVADVEYFSIITKLSKGVKFMLSHIPEAAVAWIRTDAAPQSLIGNHRAAISLEFGEDYAKEPEALKVVETIVDGIMTGQVGSYTDKSRYPVTEIMSKDIFVPPNTENAGWVSELGGYVLMPNARDYSGMLAKYRRPLSIEPQLTYK